MVIMDARHPFTDLDRQLLDWLAGTGTPDHILLTKADKLGRQEANRTLHVVQAAAAEYEHCSAQLFSSMIGTGVGTAQKTIAGWLRGNPATNKKPPVKGE